MRLASIRQAVLGMNRWPYAISGAVLAFAAGYAVARLRGRARGPRPAGEPKVVMAPAGVPRGPREAPRRGDASAPEAREGNLRAPARPCRPPATDAFSIPADRPVRISWPLDLAPGVGGRMCLRARQGANELQDLDDGWALYGFRVGRPGRFRSFLRVKWLYDGIGDPDCNNSWSAAIDEEARHTVGDDQPGPVWHWVKGPLKRLDAGVHWYLIAPREDGTFLDRIALVHEEAQLPPGGLDVLPLVSFSGLAGERPANRPGFPVREVEIEAVPTGSLVAGRGHRNELTVLASFQGKGPSSAPRQARGGLSMSKAAVTGTATEREGGFLGEIRVRSPTTRRLRVSGEARIRCSAAEPYARAVVGLQFDPRASRGGQTVVLSVVDAAEEECVYEERFTFLVPAAWAFLGPFPDQSSGGAGSADRPTEERLAALARLADPESIFGEPEATGDEPVEWKLVSDGSCYDELGAVDLFKVYGPTQDAYCYAVSWLSSVMEFRHRPLLFQSDDTAALWVDGRLTSLVPVRLARQHSRLWSGCTFRRGLNPVVVKIAQAEGYWGFRLDALDWYGHGRGSRRIRWAEPSRWPEERRGEPGRAER